MSLALAFNLSASEGPSSASSNSSVRSNELTNSSNSKTTQKNSKSFSEVLEQSAANIDEQTTEGGENSDSPDQNLASIRDTTLMATPTNFRGAPQAEPESAHLEGATEVFPFESSLFAPGQAQDPSTEDVAGDGTGETAHESKTVLAGLPLVEEMTNVELVDGPQTATIEKLTNSGVTSQIDSKQKGEIDLQALPNLLTTETQSTTENDHPLPTSIVSQTEAPSAVETSQLLSSIASPSLAPASMDVNLTSSDPASSPTNPSIEGLSSVQSLSNESFSHHGQQSETEFSATTKNSRGHSNETGVETGNSEGVTLDFQTLLTEGNEESGSNGEMLRTATPTGPHALSSDSINTTSPSQSFALSSGQALGIEANPTVRESSGGSSTSSIASNDPSSALEQLQRTLAEDLDKLRPIPTGGATLKIDSPELGQMTVRVRPNDPTTGGYRLELVVSDAQMAERLEKEQATLAASLRRDGHLVDVDVRPVEASKNGSDRQSFNDNFSDNRRQTGQSGNEAMGDRSEPRSNSQSGEAHRTTSDSTATKNQHGDNHAVNPSHAVLNPNGQINDVA